MTTMRLSDNWRTSATLTALTACLLVGAAGATHAATPADPPAIKVAYGDLDLGSVAGSQTLYRRIVSAAHDVCEARAVDIRELSGLANARACERQAITQAVHEVHSPAFAALVAAQLRHG